MVIKTFRYTQMQHFSSSLGSCPNSTIFHVLANRRIKASSKNSLPLKLRVEEQQRAVEED